MGNSVSLVPGETGYIREVDGNLQKKTPSDEDWVNLTIEIPIVITNENPTEGDVFIEFLTDITINNSNCYFSCNTDHIQIGSKSLGPNGYRPTIIIDGVSDYPGLIYNGDSSNLGYAYISVCNLRVGPENDSTLANGGGWIGQVYFGKGATNNYIVNCSSYGSIGNSSGGIVGAYAGSSSGSVVIRGCSSFGSIGNNGGGILGSNAAENGGTLTCEMCWSEGLIGQYAGGIIGINAGVDGTVTVAKCYSLGDIGTGAGGIIGSEAADSGVMTVSNSYSRGDIGTNGGGIFGSLAALNGGFTNAINCYSAGIIIGYGSRGIYGTDTSDDGIYTNCYPANGNWSDEWANDGLTGVPNSSGVGTSWIARGIDQPYEINNMGYSPYTLNNITGASELNQSFSQNVLIGETTAPAVIVNTDPSGNEFTILQITGGDEASYGTLTMNSQTGAISTTSETIPGTYTITLRSMGSYNITIYILLVSAQPAPPGPPETTTCCQSETLVRDISYTWINDYKIGKRLIVESGQNPNLKFNGYSEYIKYKMALGSGKI